MFGALRVSGRTVALTPRNVLKAHTHIFTKTHIQNIKQETRVWVAQKNNAMLLYQMR